MKRLTAAAFLLLTTFGAAWAGAGESWLGVYIRGSKIGYARFWSQPMTRAGVKGTLSESETMMNLRLLGSDLTIKVETSTFAGGDGRPITMRSKTESGGRTQSVDASFFPRTIQLTVDNNGNRSEKTLEIPADAAIVDDPMVALLDGGMTKSSFYVLDMMTLGLFKNEVAVVGEREIEVQGTKVKAKAVEVRDPRMTSTAYFSAKGDLMKMTAPMGIEMIPESKEKAMTLPEGAYVPADLAKESSIPIAPPLGDPAQYTTLELKITGVDLSSLPSGAHQTVSKSGGSWVVKVHPPSLEKAGKGGEDARWTQPSLHIPSDSPDMVKLATEIAKGADTKVGSAVAIKDWVYRNMRSNAGIGVLRDAREVLATKEGVCRDYAILAATLMRSAKIPTKLVSGVTLWNDRFYYHAWVEVWDGAQWIGLDPTESRSQISPTHVKLNDGNVEEAFTFTILDGVKIEVLGTTRR